MNRIVRLYYRQSAAWWLWDKLYRPNEVNRHFVSPYNGRLFRLCRVIGGW